MLTSAYLEAGPRFNKITSKGFFSKFEIIVFYREKKFTKNVIRENAEINIFQNGLRYHMVNRIFCIIITFYHVRNNFFGVQICMIREYIFLISIIILRLLS